MARQKAHFLYEDGLFTSYFYKKLLKIIFGNS